MKLFDALKRSGAVVMAVAVLVSGAQVTASAQSLADLPGAALLETLVVDTFAQTSTIAVNDVEPFSTNGGFAIIDPLALTSEPLYYAGLDPIAKKLTGVRRIASAAHAQGAFVVPVTARELEESGPAEGVVNVLGAELSAVPTITVSSIEGFEVAGGLALLNPGTTAQHLIGYRTTDGHNSLLVDVVGASSSSYTSSSSARPVDLSEFFPIGGDPDPIEVDPPGSGPVVVDPAPIEDQDLDPVVPDPTPTRIDPAPIGGNDLDPTIPDPSPTTVDPGPAGGTDLDPTIPDPGPTTINPGPVGGTDLDPTVPGGGTIETDPVDPPPVTVEVPPVYICCEDPDPISVNPPPIYVCCEDPAEIYLNPPPIYICCQDPDPIEEDLPPIYICCEDPAEIYLNPPPIYICCEDPDPISVDPPHIYVCCEDPDPTTVELPPIYICCEDPDPVEIDLMPIPPISIDAMPIDEVCTPPISIDTGPAVQEIQDAIAALQGIVADVDVQPYIEYLQEWIAYLGGIVGDVDVAALIQQLQRIIAQLIGDIEITDVGEVIVTLRNLLASLLGDVAISTGAADASSADVGLPERCLDPGVVGPITTPGLNLPPISYDVGQLPPVDVERDPVTVDAPALPPVDIDRDPIYYNPGPLAPIDVDGDPISYDAKPLPPVDLDTDPIYYNPNPLPAIDVDGDPISYDAKPLPPVDFDSDPIDLDPDPLPPVSVDGPPYTVDPAPIEGESIAYPDACARSAPADPCYVPVVDPAPTTVDVPDVCQPVTSTDQCYVPQVDVSPTTVDVPDACNVTPTADPCLLPKVDPTPTTVDVPDACDAAEAIDCSTPEVDAAPVVIGDVDLEPVFIDAPGAEGRCAVVEAGQLEASAEDPPVTMGEPTQQGDPWAGLFYATEGICAGLYQFVGTNDCSAGPGPLPLDLAASEPSSVQDQACEQFRPEPPTELRASSSSWSEVRLTWTDNSGSEDGFTVLRSTVPGGPYAKVGSAGPNSTAFSDFSVSGSTTYYYVVNSFNGGGDSARSNQASATTSEAPPPPTPPAAPYGLAASAVSSSQIDLAWTDPATDESGFKIQRSTSSAGPFSTIAYIGENGTTFRDSNLSGSTTYHYVVRAYNAGGDSGSSNVASATTSAPPAPPAAPSALRASTVSSSQVDLTWTDNSGNENGFRIQRSNSSGGSFSTIANLGPNATSFRDSGLGSGGTYYYVVRSFNGGGDSSPSNQASATTTGSSSPPTSPPAAPSNLNASTVSSSEINLTWADNSHDESGFRIQRSGTSGGPYSTVATVSANTWSFRDSNLNASTTYHYVVRAYNSAGESGQSNQASASTASVSTEPPPSAPDPDDPDESDPDYMPEEKMESYGPTPEGVGDFSAAAAGAGPVCAGNAQDGYTRGYRVLIIYAIARDKTGRFKDMRSHIRAWAAKTDQHLYDSSAGNRRHIRWVCNDNAQIAVVKEQITAQGDDSFQATKDDLMDRNVVCPKVDDPNNPGQKIPKPGCTGYNKADRKYLVFVDKAAVNCSGVSNIPGGEAGSTGPGKDNAANRGPYFSRVDTNGGSQTNSNRHCQQGDGGANYPAGWSELHELLHSLGAVKDKAPNSSGAGHCLDNWDIMCYDDKGGTGKPTIVCGNNDGYESHYPMDHKVDCNKNDYFDPDPETPAPTNRPHLADKDEYENDACDWVPDESTSNPDDKKRSNCYWNTAWNRFLIRGS